jgi:hypothetical protein
MWHTAAADLTKSANELLELQLSYKTCNFDTFSDISEFGKCDKSCSLIAVQGVHSLTRHAVSDFRRSERVPDMEYLMVSVQGPNMASNRRLIITAV